jgi:tRNA dimethylallyltransferase
MDAISKLPSRLVVVVGPTAAGKSELSVELAEQLGGEIVSADSRQVYRRMDVGTAKPSAALRARVPHHLIDVVDPDGDYDAATWRDQAFDVLRAVEARAGNAFVCGGTGLYVRSLVQGLFSGPAADVGLRARLEQKERCEPGALYRSLRERDPVSADRIHANDHVRIVRALEVLELSGEPMSAWQARHALADRPFHTLTLEITVDRDELYRRIDERCAAMVETGLLEELEGLRAAGYDPSLKAFDAIGYREAGMVLDGKLARADLAATIARATRRYAKRQLVWLRGQAGAVSIKTGEGGAALARVRRFLHGSGSGAETG